MQEPNCLYVFEFSHASIYALLLWIYHSICSDIRHPYVFSVFLVIYCFPFWAFTLCPLIYFKTSITCDIFISEFIKPFCGFAMHAFSFIIGYYIFFRMLRFLSCLSDFKRLVLLPILRSQLHAEQWNIKARAFTITILIC